MKLRVLAVLLVAQTAAAQQLNFVTCPVVRDTRTVPCFLAEYEGETYYLAVQQDISADQYPPQLLHEVLVEGTIEKGPRVCGGIPLKPVKLSYCRRSTRPATRSCRRSLESKLRPHADPQDRQHVSQERSGCAALRPPARPAPPFVEREWKVLYDFDSAFLFSRDTRTVNQAADYASRPKRNASRLWRIAVRRCFPTERSFVEGEASPPNARSAS
jgi:hypothetical protein